MSFFVSFQTPRAASRDTLVSVTGCFSALWWLHPLQKCWEVWMCIFTGKNSQHSWESIQSLVNHCRILPKCHSICDVTNVMSCKGERAQVQKSTEVLSNPSTSIIPKHPPIHFLLTAA